MRSRRNAAGGSTSTAPTAAQASSPARCGPSTTGFELADSFILDPHKWLFTPFDCCALLYREPELARATHTQDASYLDVIHTSDGEWNPSDYAYHLTRRARGLPLWFSLAVYGLDAYRGAIEVAASLAIQTADLIKAAPQLELIREPDLGVVLFRRLGWKPEDYDAWAQRLHQDQVAFIPPTKWEGETVGRFAFLHPDTTLELVREVPGPDRKMTDLLSLFPSGSALDADGVLSIDGCRARTRWPPSSARRSSWWRSGRCGPGPVSTPTSSCRAGRSPEWCSRPRPSRARPSSG